VRARDNTDNEGFSLTAQATVDILPVIFGSAVILDPFSEAYSSASPTIVAGSTIRFIAAFEGGVTKASVELGEKIFSLNPDPIRRRWEGKILIEEAGDYSIQLSANDGADNNFSREVGKLKVVPALKVLNQNNRESVNDAQVLLEKYDAGARVWRTDATPGQQNPQMSSDTGEVLLIASHGTYRLRVKAAGYWNGVSEQFTIDNSTAFTGNILLPRRPWYKYLIPVRTRLFPLRTEDILARTETHATEPNKELDLVLHDASGAERTLKEFAGRRVLITTIAAWNSSSHEQLSVLRRLQSELGNDVAVVPWLIQQPGTVLSSILQRGDYELDGFVDITGQDTESLDRIVLPTHFFFDRKGVLNKTRAGFATTSELLEMFGEIK
jgi:hypothetical protein